MVNKVILIGNLGRDPEVRSTPSGQPVASFTLATSRRWKDKNGQRQEIKNMFFHKRGIIQSIKIRLFSYLTPA